MLGASQSTWWPALATRCSVARPSGMATTASSALLGGTSGSCSPTRTSTGQRTAARPGRRSMSGIDGVKCRFTCGADPCLHDAVELRRCRPHRQQRGAVPRPLLLGLLAGFRERHGHRGCRVIAADLAEPFDGLGLTGGSWCSAHQRRTGWLVGVAREVPLGYEAAERGTEHHRCVQAEHIDQPREVVGPGGQVPVVRGTEVTTAVSALVGDDDLREGWPTPARSAGTPRRAPARRVRRRQQDVSGHQPIHPPGR